MAFRPALLMPLVLCVGFPSGLAQQRTAPPANAQAAARETGSHSPDQRDQATTTGGNPNGGNPNGGNSNGGHSGQASGGPLHVTSDTVEYCGHLAGRVATVHQQTIQAPPEVEILVVEGRRMCDEGHVRGGIARLRRALLLLLREAENEK